MYVNSYVKFAEPMLKCTEHAFHTIGFRVQQVARGIGGVTACIVV